MCMNTGSVRASPEAAVEASQLPDPMPKAGIDNLPVNHGQRFTIGQDFKTMRRIGIEQEWDAGEKRRLRAALASEMVGRERAGNPMQPSNVRQRTATAWLSAVCAKRAVALQQALLAHMTPVEPDVSIPQARSSGPDAGSTPRAM